MMFIPLHLDGVIAAGTSSKNTHWFSARKTKGYPELYAKPGLRVVSLSRAVRSAKRLT
jgi:hypothetical protein